jgi:hypothetical protein
MRTETRWISRVGAISLAALLAMTVGLRVVHGQAQHVRWDIIHLDATTTPPTFNPGGVAYATARNPTSLKIKLTGSGTFVSPASGGPTGAVTGGGTWETFSGCPNTCVSTGSGTYWVTRLASWEFANFQIGSFTDNIGDVTQRANGNAVLLIQYSDGSSGALGIGCHGPGAPDGIVEGVIATKDYLTYWDAEAPGAMTVDKNRTLFHFE